MKTYSTRAHLERELRTAAVAHHIYEKNLRGPDENWQRWYANFMFENEGEDTPNFLVSISAVAGSASHDFGYGLIIPAGEATLALLIDRWKMYSDPGNVDTSLYQITAQCSVLVGEPIQGGITLEPGTLLAVTLHEGELSSEETPGFELTVSLSREEVNCSLGLAVNLVDYCFSINNSN